jgi:hypothetical protein
VIKLLLSQDLITGIKYDSILIITDKLTKYIYIILYLEVSIAEDLAYAFLRIIVANYSALEKNNFGQKQTFYLMILESIHGFTRNQAETINKFLYSDG